ncbi:MAG: 50S ribosomal protein L25/general stress protein Ctc [Gemmatimonadota bacterium]|nr:50S ribosomal protein L25/general stress protein Ctc [Gemmatimonadota bacterium]
MAEAQIEATKREETGKGAARAYRREGRIPAVLYGRDQESVPLTVDEGDLHRIVQAISIENTIVDLELDGDGGGAHKVLIRELQIHPFRDEFLHVDFFEIPMDEKIRVDVPIVVEGVPEGVKNKGGVLDHQLRELEVSCMPGNIPERITLDVSELDIGEAIHVADIELPEVEIETDPERSVVAVLAPTVIEEPEEEELPEEELAEPELIGREPEEGEEVEAPEREAEAEGEEAEEEA